MRPDVKATLIVSTTQSSMYVMPSRVSYVVPIACVGKCAFGVCHVMYACASVAGCCFVTFFTRKAALKAQDALHNIKTLSGVSAFHVVFSMGY